LQDVSPDKAALLLSVIGVTNTIGRVLTGKISDNPKVNSLLMNNVCVLLSGICVIMIPFCESSYAFFTVAAFFGFFVSGYISLTSIILVDLLGLDNLTNAFGLLILFRGAASIVGAPLAGTASVFLLNWVFTEISIKSEIVLTGGLVCQESQLTQVSKTTCLLV